MRLCLPVVCLFLLLAGCAKEPTPRSTAVPPARSEQEQRVESMVLGLDQYPGEGVLVLNTEDGLFVVGPEASPNHKSELHAHLVSMRGLTVTIFFIDMPSTKSTLAHRRVTTIVVDDTEYIFSR